MATVVVSVLFTDLVGSTDLSSRLGADRSDRVRIDHFTALRRALDHHGGHEVKNVGDGIMAVFGAPVAHVLADGPDRMESRLDVELGAVLLVAQGHQAHRALAALVLQDGFDL